MRQRERDKEREREREREEGVRKRAYIEAGCPIEQLYDVSHARLACHWELILQSLNNKHHYVLPGKGVAVLKNLGGGGRGEVKYDIGYTQLKYQLTHGIIEIVAC